VVGAGVRRQLIIRPGARVPISIALSSSNPLRLALEATPTFEIGGRTVALMVSRPRIRAQRP